MTRVVVYQGLPILDDESAYQFAARLLAEGRVVGESPPDKLFWDRWFMVNDGSWYAQYFLGWPALLAPFEALGLPQLANPALHECVLQVFRDVVYPAPPSGQQLRLRYPIAFAPR